MGELLGADRTDVLAGGAVRLGDAVRVGATALVRSGIDRVFTRPVCSAAVRGVGRVGGEPRSER